MHNDHDISDRLASYADVLAGELPGTWTSSLVPADAKDDLAELTDRIWDLDLVAASLADHPLQQAALLTRPDGAQLVLLDRHDERDGFLVAAVAPRALPDEAYRAVPEPNGIALADDDPFLSAEQVAGDLLARYDTALAQVRTNILGGIQLSPTDRVVLTWQVDGSVATAPVDHRAGEILLAHGFVQGQEGIYRLPGDDTQEQARALREIGPALEAIGIGTGVQHPAGRTAATAVPASAPPAPAGARTPSVRGR